MYKYKTKFNQYREPILIREKEFSYNERISSPEKVIDMMNQLFDLSNETEEFLYELCLNSNGDITGVFEISHGTVNASLIQPREVMQKALLSGAVSIILVHNHPSGATNPSKQDCQATERIKQAGQLMGIPLSDHIIMGQGYYSFKENGMED